MVPIPILLNKQQQQKKRNCFISWNKQKKNRTFLFTKGESDGKFMPETLSPKYRKKKEETNNYASKLCFQHKIKKKSMK